LTSGAWRETMMHAVVLGTVYELLVHYRGGVGKSNEKGGGMI
jgi:hypothetical protein